VPPPPPRLPAPSPRLASSPGSPPHPQPPRPWPSPDAPLPVARPVVGVHQEKVGRGEGQRIQLGCNPHGPINQKTKMVPKRRQPWSAPQQPPHEIAQPLSEAPRPFRLWEASLQVRFHHASGCEARTQHPQLHPSTARINRSRGGKGSRTQDDRPQPRPFTGRVCPLCALVRTGRSRLRRGCVCFRLGQGSR